MRLLFESRLARIFPPLWAAFVLAGCAAPPVANAPAPKPARLAVVNLTSHAWRVVVTAVESGTARLTPIGPRGFAECEFPGGNYRIEQAMLGADGRAQLSRQFPMRLDAGENYRWQLATLMTGTEAEASGGNGGGAR